ncbi:IS5 family transposase, partial [Vitreoscilla stercoraria]
MLATIITEEQWQKLKSILLDLNVYDKPSLKKTFLGIIYRLKTGCQWRYLPSCYGKANTVFKAFRRWSATGLFYKLFKRLIQSADTEWVSIDATHIRAHQSSAGAVGGGDQSIAKSIGGNSSKIHLAVDAHGNPLEFLVGDGITHDIKIAPMLLQLLDL